jgi:hypothetical protein
VTQISLDIPTPIRVAFSGTRRGMSRAQLRTVEDVLTRWLAEVSVGGEFRHGDCVGADDQADQISRRLGYVVHSYPPVDERGRARVHLRGPTIVHPAEPFHVRDRRLVDASSRLLACPLSDAEVLRSGTWTTIRHARRTGVPIYRVTRAGELIAEENTRCRSS